MLPGEIRRRHGVLVVVFLWQNEPDENGETDCDRNTPQQKAPIFGIE
jgi:hypothetical protein